MRNPIFDQYVLPTLKNQAMIARVALRIKFGIFYIKPIIIARYHRQWRSGRAVGPWSNRWQKLEDPVFRCGTRQSIRPRLQYLWEMKTVNKILYDAAGFRDMYHWKLVEGRALLISFTGFFVRFCRWQTNFCENFFADFCLRLDLFTSNTYLRYRLKQKSPIL